MEVTKTLEGSTLTLVVSGRVNTSTAPDFENALIPSLDGIDLLVLDFDNLEYISSAGLRVILSAQKIMNRQGKMVLHNVKPQINEVFEMTGFSDFLTIE
ncbi:MAG: STAS domain-containing protein [Coriobacteriales bacterium]|nr:STAS domain-containing protein [Coriobacteriales bacterium]